jgi:hypothetical protein
LLMTVKMLMDWRFIRYSLFVIRKLLLFSV